MYSAKIKSLYEEYGELIEFCRSNGTVKSYAQIGLQTLAE